MFDNAAWVLNRTAPLVQFTWSTGHLETLTCRFPSLYIESIRLFLLTQKQTFTVTFSLNMRFLLFCFICLCSAIKYHSVQFTRYTFCQMYNKQIKRKRRPNIDQVRFWKFCPEKALDTLFLTTKTHIFSTASCERSQCFCSTNTLISYVYLVLLWLTVELEQLVQYMMKKCVYALPISFFAPFFRSR